MARGPRQVRMTSETALAALMLSSCTLRPLSRLVFWPAKGTLNVNNN